MKYSPKPNKAPHDLINESELADRLGISRSYLRRLRSEGGGPKFFKIGASVRYAMTDAMTWLEAQQRVAA